MSKKEARLLIEGLSSREASRKLERVGFNEFERKKEYSFLKLLIDQFRSPLIYVLMFAGVVTLFLHEWLDASIIFLVVLSNSLLGFWQEFKAAKSLEALKGYLKPKVWVSRDGKRQEVLMKELVPGDLVYLDAGSSVPADGLLVAAESLFTNEALLTGESRSVEKKVWPELGKIKSLGEIKLVNTHSKQAVGCLYMGTTVSGGVGELLVVKTGSETEMGKIAQSLMVTEEGLTPLQIKLNQLAKSLMWVVVGVTIVIFGIGVLRGEAWLAMFETAVAVAVAAIPEGLAVSMTVILALGMQRIFRHKALVRKLVAAETLGSVSVICSDKTGTLTEGKMRLVDFEGDRGRLVKGALLANDERDEEGRAMRKWAGQLLQKHGVAWSRYKSVAEVRKQFVRVKSIPFDSKNKYMAVQSRVKTKQWLSVVGAPDVLLAKCQLSSKQVKIQMERMEELARKGYRLIGVASRRMANTEKLKSASVARLHWDGVLAFQDSVRPNVREALVEARRAGVKVKVITGDYKDTAMAVFNQLLSGEDKLRSDQVMTGAELRELSQKELEKKILETVLFARTTPDQKLTIVNVLKKHGDVVAMTGDGVNDAPALKAADIGIVVNEASDVSKETADMVLLDSNFGTIVEAIKEGRVIYETMRKVVAYLLTDAFQELILIGGALLLGLPLPVTALQILWINLVEDGLPGVALAFDAVDEGVMDQPPKKRDASILDGELKALIGVIGVMSNLVLLGLYAYLLRNGAGLAELQTFMFVGIGTNSLLYVFSLKSLRKPLWNENLLDNKFLLMAVALGFGLMLASVYVPFLQTILGTVPLGLNDMLLVFGLGLLTITLIETVKWIFVTVTNKKK